MLANVIINSRMSTEAQFSRQFLFFAIFEKTLSDRVNDLAGVANGRRSTGRKILLSITCTNRAIRVNGVDSCDITTVLCYDVFVEGTAS